MAVGEMWLPRTAIRRRQEMLLSVRHPTALEPLMLHSARDEKGKAQESIGSWAFPSCPVGAGHLPSNQKQDVRSSDKVLRSRQLSSSELGENRVTSDMPRAHTPIYVFVRFRVHILMCSHINT